MKDAIFSGSPKPEKKKKDRKHEDVIELDDLESPLAEEKLTIVEQGEDDSGTKEDDIHNKFERCNDAWRRLIECIHKMKDCIDSASRV